MRTETCTEHGETTGSEDRYLLVIRPHALRGRGLFEAPQRLGYTNNPALAGRFPLSVLDPSHLDGTNPTRYAVRVLS